MIDILVDLHDWWSPFPLIYACSLLSQMPAAAKVNKGIYFLGLHVYGLLTDTIQFKFYSYEPTTKQFFYGETIYSDCMRTNMFPKIDWQYTASPLGISQSWFVLSSVSIGSLVSWCQATWKVYVQLLKSVMTGKNTMMLANLPYIVYEFTNIFAVFIHVLLT